MIPVTGQTVFDHLAGRHTVGVYPLLSDDTCHFLAVDFDDAEWREDARAFAGFCDALDVPVALEVSRSGHGAHEWIFFSARVSARDARRLGTALISHTCARTRQLKLSSYDRLFPNQDTMPKGGFGNLIALPLQKAPRESGGSVFVDRDLQPHDDQWAFLAGIPKMSPADIDPTILRATGARHPLDVTFIDSEDQATPWRRQGPASSRLPSPMPASLKITLANLVYFEKAALPQPLANRLIRLAAFQDPEFYKAQALRLPVWDEPRVIGCAESFPQHIALPRGCLEAAFTLLRENGIRPDQRQAVDAMLAHDTGVLCAPTAFGRTVTAAALIAARGVNTLILIHRAELLRQWRERLQTFLAATDGEGGSGPSIGAIGGAKSKPTGRIDIALMQSLCRQGEVNALVEDYGHIVVDECHHLSAFSFEAILKRARAKYVLGLTATPIRRDGGQPMIFMQCGPTRHTAEKPSGAPQALEIVPRYLTPRVGAADDAPIQAVFQVIASDAERTAQTGGRSSPPWWTTGPLAANRAASSGLRVGPCAPARRGGPWPVMAVCFSISASCRGVSVASMLSLLKPIHRAGPRIALDVEKWERPMARNGRFRCAADHPPRAPHTAAPTAAGRADGGRAWPDRPARGVVAGMARRRPSAAGTAGPGGRTGGGGRRHATHAGAPRGFAGLSARVAEDQREPRLHPPPGQPRTGRRTARARHTSIGPAGGAAGGLR